MSRESKQYKSAQAYLQSVAAAAQITRANVTVDEEEEEIELVGFVRELPVRIVLRPDTRFRRLEFHHEKDLQTTLEIAATRSSDVQVELAPGVYIGSRPQAITFRKLPEPVRTRVLAGLRAADLESLSKRPKEVVLSPKHRADEVKDSVNWLANTLVTTAELLVALGSRAPIPDYERMSDEVESARRWAAYEALAARIGSTVGGTIAADRDDEEIVIEWDEQGQEMRLVLDADFHALDVSMNGFAGYFRLAWEPYPGKLEPGDVRLWLAPEVCVEGEPAFANDIVTRLRSLPPSELAALCAGIVAFHIDGFGVEDGEFGGTIAPLSKILDGGAAAIELARLVRRVAEVLPRE